MAGPRWTIDEDDDIVYGPDKITVAELCFFDTPYNEAVAGMAALRDAVRDADTLTRARQLAAHATDVTAKNSEVAKAMRVLLDLLTADPS